jgi:hypothetical protein
VKAPRRSDIGPAQRGLWMTGRASGLAGPCPTGMGPVLKEDPNAGTPRNPIAPLAAEAPGSLFFQFEIRARLPIH